MHDKGAKKWRDRWIVNPRENQSREGDKVNAGTGASRAYGLRFGRQHRTTGNKLVLGTPHIAGCGSYNY